MLRRAAVVVCAAYVAVLSLWASVDAVLNGAIFVATGFTLIGMTVGWATWEVLRK